MRVSSCFCVLAALTAVTIAQENTNFVQTEFTIPTDPNALNSVLGVFTSMQIQQAASQRYGQLMLNYQSAMGWLQVANGWAKMDAIDNDRAPSASAFGSMDAGNDDDVEAKAEKALLYVLKLMYIQAANKFALAQQSNYQSKVLISTLQATAAANPQANTAVYLLYYLETLRLMGSAVTIQRQDAWNTWLLHEIMETNEFDGDLPYAFQSSMSKAREVAMQTYYQEASLDYQILNLEYYLQMLAGIPPQSNAASAASSFLEVEAQAEPAEPNKPFFPMMMGAMGPQYLGYMNLYLKYMSNMLNLQAAQGLFLHAHAEVSTDGSSVDTAQVKSSAIQALQQWAYLKFQQSLIQWWGMFSGAPAASAAAASNALLETGAEATPSN